MPSKGDKTRECIKQAAYPLFVERGFKEVAMKDICEVTGLSRGGLYRHFGSTAELFEEIWRGLVSNTEEDLEQRMRAGHSARKMLRDILEARKREMEEKDKSLTLSVCEYSHAVSSEMFIELNEKSKIMWGKMIRYGMERGEFAQVDVDAVVDMILFSYQGARMWSRILPVDKGVSKHLVDCIWDMLVPDERRETL